MSLAFASVLGLPAVVITMEEYYAVIKRVRQGPPEAMDPVKIEPEDDVTDIYAKPGVAQVNASDGAEAAGIDAPASPPAADEGQAAPVEEGSEYARFHQEAKNRQGVEGVNDGVFAAPAG